MFWHDSTAWTTLFITSEWVIRLVMLAIVPFRRSPAAAKGWLLLIFFEPWIGLALYCMLGRARLPRWRRERMASLPRVMAGALARLKSDPLLSDAPLQADFSQAGLLAKNLGKMPALAGNSVEILVDYDGSIARLVSDIDQARDQVHLLYYIFADDAATAPVIAALGRAVQRGVTCRVLVDFIGSHSALRTLLPKLRQLGVHVREMLPARLLRWRRARLDLRNHRKIAVIDGCIGYTGSQNLVSSGFKKGMTFEELVLRLTGPAVLELQIIFVADWFLETEEVLEESKAFPDPQQSGPITIQVLPSGPDFPTQNNQRLIVALIHAARRNVVITTPYFIPDEPLLQALQTAVLRGVDVHLIVSEIADQVLVALAQRSYYQELLEAGVKIHLYGKHFLHAKFLCIDDEISVVGTSNMDIRSFALNAELVLVIYDSDTTRQLHAEQERYMADGRLLGLEQWQRRSFPRRFADNLARLFSPLL